MQPIAFSFVFLIKLQFLSIHLNYLDLLGQILPCHFHLEVKEIFQDFLTIEIVKDTSREYNKNMAIPLILL